MGGQRGGREGREGRGGGCQRLQCRLCRWPVEVLECVCVCLCVCVRIRGRNQVCKHRGMNERLFLNIHFKILFQERKKNLHPMESIFSPPCQFGATQGAVSRMCESFCNPWVWTAPGIKRKGLQGDIRLALPSCQQTGRKVCRLNSGNGVC